MLSLSSSTQSHQTNNQFSSSRTGNTEIGMKRKLAQLKVRTTVIPQKNISLLLMAFSVTMLLVDPAWPAKAAPSSYLNC